MGSGFYKEEVLYIYIYIYTLESAQTIYSERAGAESQRAYTHSLRTNHPKKNQFIYVAIVSGLSLDPTHIACDCNVRAHNESFSLYAFSHKQVTSILSYFRMNLLKLFF
jgi:hypothetical protein